MRTAVVTAVKEQVPGVQRPELRVMLWAEKPRALMGNSGRRAGRRAGTLSRGTGEPQGVSRGGVRPALGVERPSGVLRAWTLTGRRSGDGGGGLSRDRLVGMEKGGGLQDRQGWRGDGRGRLAVGSNPRPPPPPSSHPCLPVLGALKPTGATR